MTWLDELAEKSWLKLELETPTPPENVAVTEPLLAPVQLASVAVSDSEGAGGAPTVTDWVVVQRLASRTITVCDPEASPVKVWGEV